MVFGGQINNVLEAERGIRRRKDTLPPERPQEEQQIRLEVDFMNQQDDWWGNKPGRRSADDN